jgi:hypothetical protein
MSEETETATGGAASSRSAPHAKKAGGRARARAKAGAARRQTLADVIRKAVDEGATTAEDIHKAVADLPLEMIARLDGFEDALKDVRRVQKESIGAIYDLIRRINRDVTRLADDALRSRVRGIRARGRRAAKSSASARA